MNIPEPPRQRSDSSEIRRRTWERVQFARLQAPWCGGYDPFGWPGLFCFLVLFVDTVL